MLLICTYTKHQPIDVKMDWCNTKVNGSELDPKDQYPQMVRNEIYLT